MQKMTTIRGEEIYIDLCSIKAIRPETRTVNAHKMKHEQSEEPTTMINLGGGFWHIIKEPDFKEILTKTKTAHRNR